MKLFTHIHTVTATLVAVGLLAIVGCSSNSPTQPTGLTERETGPGEDHFADLFKADDTPGNKMELAGRVDEIDAHARTFTFSGSGLHVNVSKTAKVTQTLSGGEMVLDLGGIGAGDSVVVVGSHQSDGSFLANRVQLQLSSSADIVADTRFAGIVGQINYAAGILTVDSRPEKIVADAASFLFVDAGKKRVSGNALSGGDEDQETGDTRLKLGVEITDLSVGDSIEVHANAIDGTALYAVAIELADGKFIDGQQVGFTNVLATVDAPSGIVSFQTDARTATVVDGAELSGPVSEPLELSDFSAGEQVEVHGFLSNDGSLLVVHMQKLSAS